MRSDKRYTVIKALLGRQIEMSQLILLSFCTVLSFARYEYLNLILNLKLHQGIFAENPRYFLLLNVR